MRPDALKKLLQLLALPVVLVAFTLGFSPRGGLNSARGRTKVQGRSNWFAFSGGAPTGHLEGVPGAAAPLPLTSPGGWFRVSLMASFPERAQAEQAARELTGLLEESARYLEDPARAEERAQLLDEESPAPLTPPVAAFLAGRGISGLVGIGWGGPSEQASQAIHLLDRLLVLRHLKGDFAGFQPNPLVGVLEQAGAQVLVEGDPSHGRQVEVDLSCFAPDEATAKRLGEHLQSYLSLPTVLHARPPWHPGSVSRGETEVRLAYLSLNEATETAVTETYTGELLRRVADTRTPEESQELQQEIRAEVLRAVREVVNELAEERGLEPALVADYLAVLEGDLADAADPGGGQRDRPATQRMARRMGQLELEVRHGEFGGSQLVPKPSEQALTAQGLVRVKGRRIDLGQLSFSSVANGFPQLVRYLWSERCSNLRYALVQSHAGD